MLLETKKNLNQLHLYEKRVKLLVGARYKDSNAVTSAIRSQDKIRKKIGNWKGAEEVQKWREKS